jgi:hypothetical protein
MPAATQYEVIVPFSLVVDADTGEEKRWEAGDSFSHDDSKVVKTLLDGVDDQGPLIAKKSEKASSSSASGSSPADAKPESKES